MTVTFNRATEAAAYLYLHDHTYSDFREKYGMIAGSLVNDWHDSKVVRITYPGGGLKVATFKKYAEQARQVTGSTEEQSHFH